MTHLADFLANLPTDEDACWIWPGKPRSDGYGVSNVKPHPDAIGGFNWKKAHRAVYEALVGPIPPGLTLDHLCRQKMCVNPKHLEPVSMGENVRRAHKRFGQARLLRSGRWQARFMYHGVWHKAPSTFATRAEAEQWLSANNPRNQDQS